MENYVKSALVASYWRPDDAREALERYREVSRDGYDSILSELFCAAADYLHHVRHLASQKPGLPVVLASVGSAPYWLCRCLQCLEPKYSVVAFDFSGRGDSDTYTEPSEEQRLSYDSVFQEKIRVDSARHYIFLNLSWSGRSLKCFIDMLTSYRDRCCPEGFVASILQMCELSVVEDAKVADLLCSSDDVPCAFAAAFEHVKLKSPTVVGACGCGLKSFGDVVPRGTHVYPCTAWGRDPSEASQSGGWEGDRFDVERFKEFGATLEKTNVVGAANLMRAYGNRLFGAELFEAAAVAYVNSRLYLEKVVALTKGPDASGSLDLAQDSIVRSCRLSCATNAAVCQFKLGKLDECLRACDDALAIDSTSVKALFRKAVVLQAKGDTPGAERSLRLAESFAPDDPSIKKELAKLAQHKKKHEQTDRAFAKKIFG